ncbi:MAG TPA: hypothetical protein VNU24_04680, partial [Solirubrobacteraceae bacterium]|nr:hypothetical protein [Solirubrobacteraceae bacterium]
PAGWVGCRGRHAATSPACRGSSRNGGCGLVTGAWRFTREQASRTVYVLRVLPRGRADRD